MASVKESLSPIEVVLQQGKRRSRVIQRDTHEAVRSLSSALSLTHGKKIPEEYLPKVVNLEPGSEKELMLEPVAMPQPASALTAPLGSKLIFSEEESEETTSAPASVDLPGKAEVHKTPQARPQVTAPTLVEAKALPAVPVRAVQSSPLTLGPNEVFFPKGHVLFEKGDRADFFYVLVSGKVALFEPSNQSFIANLEPGSSFGEQAILVGGVRSLTAQAAEPTVCKAISAQILGKMLNQEKGTIKPVIYALLLELYMTNDLKSQGLG